MSKNISYRICIDTWLVGDWRAPLLEAVFWAIIAGGRQPRHLLPPGEQRDRGTASPSQPDHGIYLFRAKW